MVVVLNQMTQVIMKNLTYQLILLVIVIEQLLNMIKLDKRKLIIII